MGMDGRLQSLDCERQHGVGLFPMSLINKMLQDLDARRSEVTGVDAYGLQIRPVPARRRLHAAWWVAVGLGVALLAVIAWELLRPATVAIAGRIDTRPYPITEEKKLAPVNPITPQASSAGSPMDTTPAPVGRPVVQANAAPVAPVEVADKQSPVAKPTASAVASEKPMPEARHSKGRIATDKLPHTSKASATALAMNMPAPAAKRSAATEPAAKKAPIASAPDLPKAVPAEKPVASAPSAKSSDAVAPANLNKQLKELTPQQRADNEYRKSVSLIQQGKATEAMNGMEQALQLDPRHASARQSLVGLLLEGRRQDEALRSAREGLSLDSAQPGLAMIAARLQLEKSDLRPAIQTLEKTLPYAADRADYQSFLAALLQRDGRNKEAVEHYLIALQKAPQNGVWWMGLGISFQADNRLAEAHEAFARAKASNSLSSELLAFVESKLKQLQR
jgi:MSHA biogenesis protein MshN